MASQGFPRARVSGRPDWEGGGGKPAATDRPCLRSLSHSFPLDFLVGTAHRDDAEGFWAELRERVEQFNLELHPEKTRLIEFGRFAAARRQRRGQGKPETFDFLGFTHITCCLEAVEKSKPQP
jgi:hypothetical protein